MLVNALYGIVDRIFIGRFVSEIAIGGLSLVMPLMAVAFAFSMLYGVGAANMISMRLGQGRKEEAENALNHCFFLLITIGAVIIVLGLVFIDELLSMMGAQPGSEAIEYAKSYFRITLYGNIFMQLGFGLSHIARAQGFPLISMIRLLVGGVLNIIFDAIFIVGFGWGVEGAAWATVVAQAVSCVWMVAFCFGKKPVIKLKPWTFKPSFKIIYDMTGFGFPQFLMQFLASAVILLFNTILGIYGPRDLGVANGGDIALSGYVIVNTIANLFFMPVVGINQGAQPILGYNYGAKRFDRVFKTFTLAVISSTVICTIGFLVVQLFPLQITKIFVADGSEVLLSFSVQCMRVVMLLAPVLGFQVIAANLFVVTGRPKITTIINTLRQAAILVPVAIIFGNIWGLWGFIAAVPVTDGIAFIITGVIIFFELKKLRRESLREAALQGDDL
jgi:putative MATE family efflux protein